jgi:hypothetical protein
MLTTTDRVRQVGWNERERKGVDSGTQSLSGSPGGRAGGDSKSEVAYRGDFFGDQA